MSSNIYKATRYGVSILAPMVGETESKLIDRMVEAKLLFAAELATKKTGTIMQLTEEGTNIGGVRIDTRHGHYFVWPLNVLTMLGYAI